MSTQEIKTNEEIVQIDFSLINPSPFNPRRALPNIPALRDSIQESGIIEPLIVRPLSISVDSVGGNSGFEARTYEMVSGHRRMAAAKLANIHYGPCVIRELTDEQAKEIALITALQREGLHPYDEAALIANLLMANNGDAPKVAMAIGKHVIYVRRRIVLLNLIPPAAEAFKKDKFGLDVAFLLARTTSETQKACLTEAKNRDGLTAQTVDWFCRQRTSELKDAPWNLDDAELFPKAGACTACPKQTGNQHSLFDEKSEKNLCLDMVCFKTKLANYVKQKKEKEPDLTLVRQNWQPHGMGELAREQFIVPQDKSVKCETMAPALMVDGGYKKMVVCTNPKCKIHSARSFKAAGPDRKAELKKQRETKAVAAALYDVLTNKPGGGLGTDDIKVITRFAWDRMWHDLKGAYLKHRGLDKNYDMESDIEMGARARNEVQLIGFALVTLLDPRMAGTALTDFQRLYKHRPDPIDMAEIKRIALAPKEKPPRWRLRKPSPRKSERRARKKENSLAAKIPSSFLSTGAPVNGGGYLPPAGGRGNVTPLGGSKKG